MSTEIKQNKIHTCDICGEETEDYEHLPNGKKIWICSSPTCYKDLRETAADMESEARSRAEEDDYSRYY